MQDYTFITLTEHDVLNNYGFIYITTNCINNKKYIGQRKFSRGWKNYLGSGYGLINAIKKYGKENFKREIICLSKTKEELDEHEIFWINKFNAVDDDSFYNIHVGGTGGYTWGHLSDEEIKIIKEKISTRSKEMWKDENYRNKMLPIMQKEQEKKRGIPLSQETREKLRVANLGKTLSEEHKKNLAIAMRQAIDNKITTVGYWFKPTEEQKLAISKRMKEYYANGGIHPRGMLGKKHSQRFCNIMSEKMSGENNPMCGIDSWAHMTEEQRRNRINKTKNTWNNKSEEEKERYSKLQSKNTSGGNNPRAKRCVLTNVDTGEKIDFSCVREAALYLFEKYNPNNIKSRSIEYHLKECLKKKDKLYENKYKLTRKGEII